MDISGGGDTSSPYYNLSLSDPNCFNESCQAFLDAENASQAAISWASQFLYGHWTTYYYIAILGLLTIFHVSRTILDKRTRPVTTSSGSSSSLYQQATAFRRSLGYRTARPLVWMGLPSVGIGAFILMTIAVLSALTFAVKPYYRQHLEYGSPPLAIRTGLMAFACTPILIALAGKANIVTLLTGISHERLNVIHRWVAWMSLVLSGLHGFPFFMQSSWEGSFYRVSSAENVKTQFYFYGFTGGSEASGVPPFAILVGLCFLSLPWIRDRFYESFYFSHILLAITYLGLLFWHAGNIMDSWAYLWATLALWLSSWLARTFWRTRPLNIKSQWFVGSPAIVEALPGGMTRVRILAPHDFTWSTSQHTFLRFPTLSLLDNHPFTIVSAPPTESEKTHELPTISFLIRSHSGFTRKLAAFCASEPDRVANACIDGPYGGISRPIERLYDTVILIAGGSGISACMPWLSFLADQAKSAGGMRVKRVVLVWAMRRTEHFHWVEKELLAAVESKVPGLDIVLQFHVTDAKQVSPTRKEESGDKSSVIADIDGADSPGTAMERLGEVVYQRPVMTDILSVYVGEGKTMVFGCGPEGLRQDLSNACASAQSRVLKGEAQEVVMHLEAFGW